MSFQNTKYRMVQRFYHMFVMLMKRQYPTCVNRPGAVADIPKALKEDGFTKTMIITDEGLVKAGIVGRVEELIKAEGIEVVRFDKTIPNPTSDLVLECLDFIKANKPQCLIALGGGSSMDAAKVAMAMNAMPKLCPVSKLGGTSKVTPKVKKDKLLPLYAIPTTSGTGSEVTTVAAITDSATHAKYTVTDEVLMPKRVFLDAELTLGLPKSVTAASGMDALTHCCESYLGIYYANEKTDQHALNAVELIMGYLKAACDDGSDLNARDKMANGSYEAALSFSQAGVGYAHSFSHATASFSSLPHGTLTAIMLPAVMEYYFDVSKEKLAKMAQVSHVTSAGKSVDEQARDFIEAVKKLREDIGLPAKLPKLPESELEQICVLSLKEANPIYPVPRIMDMKDAREFMHKVSEA